MNGGENKIVTHSATQLPNGGKQPVSNKLVIAVVSLAILTFLGILSETSLNIAYSTPKPVLVSVRESHIAGPTSN